MELLLDPVEKVGKGLLAYNRFCGCGGTSMQCLHHGCRHRQRTQVSASRQQTTSKQECVTLGRWWWRLEDSGGNSTQHVVIVLEQPF